MLEFLSSRFYLSWGLPSPEAAGLAATKQLVAIQAADPSVVLGARDIGDEMSASCWPFSVQDLINIFCARAPVGAIAEP